MLVQYRGVRPKLCNLSTQPVGLKHTSLYDSSRRVSWVNPESSGISLIWLSLNSRSSKVSLQPQLFHDDTSPRRFCLRFSACKCFKARTLGSISLSLLAVRST
jgi:hypothetical protein